MEVDDIDQDSTFGDGNCSTGGSTTTSIRSAITKYEFEHGRRYHAYKAGRYVMPNDERELERMDIEHHNQGLQLGALHLAPIGSTPQHILDVGTGNGIWAIDMADQYPSATVTGIDLSPVQATWVPPNAMFEIDDFEDEWTFGADKFDLVHMRHLLSSVSDYVRLYKQAFHALKPGGWLEINEVALSVYCDDGTFPEDTASVKWAHWFDEACIKLGRPVPKLEQYKPRFEQAGFVDVQERVRKRPTNDWPKDPRMKEIGRVSGCWISSHVQSG
jgi:ubiquinone/menaquinone biosynthesis C-methylase UbiE